MALRLHRPQVLTPIARARLYNQAYPDYPPLGWTDRWLYGIWDFDEEQEQLRLLEVYRGQRVMGVWEIGNDYRNKSDYYGAYPKGYVQRVQTLFPDMDPQRTLHLFAGKFDGSGIRVDCLPALNPTIAADAQRLPFKDNSFDFVMADPSYSPQDSITYGTPHPDKKKVLHELARVVRPGGHLVWLDIPKPMYRKTEWQLWGEIGILRSTNHRGRFAFLFSRV